MKKERRGRKPIPHHKMIESLQAFFKKMKKQFTILEYDLWSKKHCRARTIMRKLNKGWHGCLKKAGIK